MTAATRRESSEPIWDWFGLTYSSYFCIPRSALQALPVDWQRRFVALMDEANDMGLETPSDYECRRRDKRTGRYIEDPWSNYRRPNIEHLLPACLRVKSATESDEPNSLQAVSAED